MVRGDAISYAVAAASVVAKVERDRMMSEYDRVYPQYGFALHKGYAVAGASPRHRDLRPQPDPSAHLPHRGAALRRLPTADLGDAGVVA